MAGFVWGALALAGPALPVPADWGEIGTVNAWMDLDVRLNRGDISWLDLTVARDRQGQIYQRTLEPAAGWTVLRGEAFAALPEAERRRRRERARQELQPVARLYTRLSTPGTWTWHAQQTDVDLMEEVLGGLNRATGLDPLNPYAWHLLGWLRAQIGDLDQARYCYEQADAALARFADDEFVDMRRRLALDRAWDLRDLGRFEAAGVQIARAEQMGGPDFETRLLRGLLAAALGDQVEAERYARLVGQVGSYGRSHGRAVAKVRWRRLNKYGGTMATGWIQALAWLRLGYVEQAAVAFPEWGLGNGRLLSPWFAHRFWRDAGYIYYLTDRTDLAQTAWQLGVNFTPYRPFFVHRRYASPPKGMAGLPDKLPFYLNFGRFWGGGSRFGYALALTRDLTVDADEADRDRKLESVQKELFTCLRNGEFTPQTYLTLEHLFRRSGQLPQADSCHEQAVAAFRALGYDVTSGAPGTMVVLSPRRERSLSQTVIYGRHGDRKVAWKDTIPVQAALDRIQNAYIDYPSPKTRRELARFLIRQLQIDEGRELLLHGRGSRPGAGDDMLALEDADLEVALEADRGDGTTTTARLLVDRLASGRLARARSATVWALVGTILLESGDEAGGVAALQQALVRDPDNGGLRLQLRMLAD